LAKKEGEQVYNTLFSFLTQLEFSPEDAKKSWKRIVEHKGKLETKLGHPISLMTAVCYYLSDVKKYQYPAYHRIKTARGYKKQSHSDDLTGLFLAGVILMMLCREK
jgi:hypothetical protein